ncbi:pre-mRNA-splicing factor ATP-dependent RNA helicase DEAH10 [Lactuca sativa]|uniref:RNA helicase n=1 Tax=Lactuca sativa TaxID=4236 RepID=A0A9R1UDF6_LACSA|nr:pre-mRNA-splicing factor ATP-dependent RNA helicase DEAH10 [Lactuca sativa]KAJ0185096.1 hypothetical protein LSAT_V11C900494360 [Lactuca sativa]
MEPNNSINQIDNHIDDDGDQNSFPSHRHQIITYSRKRKHSQSQGQNPICTLHISASFLLDAKTLVTIFQIHLEEGPGDILVFLFGHEDNESIEGLVCENLKKLPEANEKNLNLAIVLFSSIREANESLYSCSYWIQKGTLVATRLIKNSIKLVILETNIAETSVTIPGINYVIDPGLLKVRSYSPDSGIESLIVVKTSKDQSLQRSDLENAALSDTLVPRKNTRLSNIKLTFPSLIYMLKIKLEKIQLKALEAMVVVGQVKSEFSISHISNSPSKKLEKNGSRKRGFGSPFKCIGIGLAQQLKSERDEELATVRKRIEELEALAASRQKEA